MARQFFVETPLGRLKVYSKYETDNPDSYPGVYVDLVRHGRSNDEGELLACVEYESADGEIQTCVYQPGVEDPVQIVTHNTTGENAEEE